MSEPAGRATCDECGSLRPEAHGPCPYCGRHIRNLVMNAEPGRYRVSGGRADLVRDRCWLQVRWLALAAAAGLAVVGYLVGGLVGLVLTVAAGAVGVEAFARVREREIR